jgi:glycosyltransferase involved in cell wall biosynthesis
VTSVSIVICTYSLDRWLDLVSAVDSAAEQARGGDEVIVVVDHNPALREQVAAQWPRVQVVENGGPNGLSGARNSGVEAAGGDVVAFLDDDARAEAGWLAALTHPYADEAVVGTGGRAVADWEGGRPPWFPVEFDWVVGCSYRGLPEKTSVVRNPLGCNMSFRRAALVESGGFRSDLGRVGRFPVGGEETELSIRMHAVDPGRSIVYVPDAAVQHHVTPARATWRYFRSRCYQEGRSKAAIRSISGAGPALSTERSYVSRTLPRGMLRGVADLLRGDRWGIARSAVIAVGALLTLAGFLVGSTGRGRLRTAAPGAPAGA